MGSIIEAMIIGQLTKRVNLLEKILIGIKPTLQEIVDVIDEDDKRINDLHKKIVNLEKIVNGLQVEASAT
jgi:hypothetical protein